MLKTKPSRIIVHAPAMEKPPIGLGDAVAFVAQPIAKAADALLGTDIQNCGGCKKRREAWNKAVPNIIP